MCTFCVDLIQCEKKQIPSGINILLWKWQRERKGREREWENECSNSLGIWNPTYLNQSLVEAREILILAALLTVSIMLTETRRRQSFICYFLWVCVIRSAAKIRNWQPNKWNRINDNNARGKKICAVEKQLAKRTRMRSTEVGSQREISWNKR